MRRIATAVLTGAMFLTVPLLTACDREVKHEESTRTTSDGTVSKEETTKRETPSGAVVTEHSKTVDNTPSH